MKLPLLLLTLFLPYSYTLSGLSRNQKALNDITFPRSWVPMASTLELDPDRPTPLMFQGQRYVAAYFDGQWRILDDVCPHRLAPLSEGRINRDSNLLECSYHGWGFTGNGECAQIPQMTDLPKTNCPSVTSYSTLVEKNVLFFWPWADEDALSALQQSYQWTPERLVHNIPADASTYTRDLPYSWETLVENIVDPAHVPWAHHNLQGKREDAIPINMTTPLVSQEGFSFQFQDRTMNMMRQGTGEFRAPYAVSYSGTFNSTKRPFFNLTTLLIPTKPGWSRIIIYQGGTSPNERKKRKPSIFSVLFKILPTWMLHQFSNRFLDSDLVFLHAQEQQRVKGDNYFMPAESDRCIVALQKWIRTYASETKDLPPLIEDRSILFDHLRQHTDQCRHCNKALEGISKYRKIAYRILVVSVLLAKFMAARVLVAASLLALGFMNKSEQALKRGEFKHYLNN